MIDDGDWTINDKPRLEGDPQCQAIMAMARACDGCPLNPVNKSATAMEPVSAYLAFIIELENVINAGIPLTGFTMTKRDRRAIILIKSERNRVESERMKQKR